MHCWLLKLSFLSALHKPKFSRCFWLVACSVIVVVCYWCCTRSTRLVRTSSLLRCPRFCSLLCHYKQSNHVNSDCFLMLIFWDSSRRNTLCLPFILQPLKKKSCPSGRPLASYLSLITKAICPKQCLDNTAVQSLQWKTLYRLIFNIGEMEFLLT